MFDFLFQKKVERRAQELTTPLLATIEHLRMEKERFAAIVSHMAEGVLAVDADGRLLAMNQSLMKLFSVDEPSPLGKPLLDVLRHGDINHVVQNVFQDRRSYRHEVKAFTPVEHIFDVQGVPLFQDGIFQGALLVFYDMTRLRRLENMRREFVANVTHDLRTPLASIKGSAETLRLGALDDKKNRMSFLQTIEDQADHMTRLVESLLELAVLESGGKTPQKEPFNLAGLIEEVFKSLRPVAEKQKVTLQTESQNAVPPIIGDRAQLKQALMNLVDNAIKFNRSRGTVNVSAQWDETTIHLRVTDRGIGIPAPDLPRIFERFYRVDKSRTNQSGGTGLGLAIVKHIAEAHGGTASAQSTEGLGSTFQISLPRLVFPS